MVKLQGIDVSHWQGNVDWHKVKASGVDFVFVKCSQGTNYTDPNFKANVNGAVAAGLHVGAYHYGDFDTVAEAKVQAAYFLKQIHGLHLTYPVVLDLEEDKKNVGVKQLTDSAIAFLEELEKAGYFAVLYSSDYFFGSQLDGSRLTKYARWLARYGGNLTNKADIWQYTQSGHVNGISGNVDLNTSYRDFALEISLMNKAVHHTAPKPEYHTVIKGENATLICKKYHTTLSNLDRLNPSVKDWDLIYPNQKLRVK